jgi:hypothetical protein
MFDRMCHDLATCTQHIPIIFKKKLNLSSVRRIRHQTFQVFKTWKVFARKTEIKFGGIFHTAPFGVTSDG